MSFGSENVFIVVVVVALLQGLLRSRQVLSHMQRSDAVDAVVCLELFGAYR